MTAELDQIKKILMDEYKKQAKEYNSLHSSVAGQLETLCDKNGRTHWISMPCAPPETETTEN